MALKTYNPTTPSRRGMVVIDRSGLWKGKPVKALTTGKLRGAGLDVLDREPPDPNNKLFQLENVIFSPHMAGVTKEARANMGKFAAEQLIHAFDGKRPPRVVNPEVWPVYQKRYEAAFGKRPE